MRGELGHAETRLGQDWVVSGAASSLPIFEAVHFKNCVGYIRFRYNPGSYMAPATPTSFYFTIIQGLFKYGLKPKFWTSCSQELPRSLYTYTRWKVFYLFVLEAFHVAQPGFKVAIQWSDLTLILCHSSGGITSVGLCIWSYSRVCYEVYTTWSKDKLWLLWWLWRNNLLNLPELWNQGVLSLWIVCINYAVSFPKQQRPFAQGAGRTDWDRNKPYISCLHIF